MVRPRSFMDMASHGPVGVLGVVGVSLADATSVPVGVVAGTPRAQVAVVTRSCKGGAVPLVVRAILGRITYLHPVVLGSAPSSRGTSGAVNARGATFQALYGAPLGTDGAPAVPALTASQVLGVARTDGIVAT